MINGAEEAVEVAKGMAVAHKGMAVLPVDKNTEVSNSYLTALLLAHAAHGQSLLLCLEQAARYQKSIRRTIPLI